MSAVLDTDRIERSIVINGSRERVWRALTNAEEFGAWFGANLAGQVFEPGRHIQGPMTLPGCEHLVFDAVINRIEPQDLFSMHWHPYSGEPESAYVGEEPTLVTFTLKEAGDKGILLTVVESGFDKVPAHRRRRAFDMHSEGWDFQMKNVASYAGDAE
ncbi:MAG: vanillate O-demethylase oxidoreductase VanB [Paucimonas sp.]|nr:vanillate O-demethylase oxidoreductase VanB [Paucimonas sp.]